MKKYTVQLTTEGDTPSDVADELIRAAVKIRVGKHRGYSRGGSWNLMEKRMCSECGGVDGKHEDITTMESVSSGEPHLQAPVGTAKCPNAG